MHPWVDLEVCREGVCPFSPPSPTHPNNEFVYFRHRQPLWGMEEALKQYTTDWLASTFLLLFVIDGINVQRQTSLRESKATHLHSFGPFILELDLQMLHCPRVLFQLLIQTTYFPILCKENKTPGLLWGFITTCEIEIPEPHHSYLGLILSWLEEMNRLFNICGSTRYQTIGYSIIRSTRCYTTAWRSSRTARTQY